MKLVGEVSGIKIYALGESEMVLNSDTACALGRFFEAVSPMRYAAAAFDTKELCASLAGWPQHSALCPKCRCGADAVYYYCRICWCLEIDSQNSADVARTLH